MKRRHVLAGAAAVIAAPRLSRAQGKSVLRFVPQADLGFLDPGMTTATVTRNHAMMIFDTLFALDANGDPVPQMIEPTQPEEGGRLWTLTLREGLLFHDGAKVLASDCVASIKRWGRVDPFGKTLLAATEELSAPDDRHIVFRMKKPFPLLPAALAKTIPRTPFIMPARVIPSDPAKPVTEMVGSGPYRYLADERVPGARVVYARNPAYVPLGNGTPGISSGPKRVYFDRVEWQVIPDPATALAAIKQGEVDWWERPFPDLVAAARRDPGLSVDVTNKTGTIAFLQFNNLYPPFDNVAIRRLVQSAIDQSVIAEAIAGSDPAMRGGKTGIFMPGGPMASTAGLEAISGRTDFAALKAEVIAAGYKNERVVMLVGTDSPVNNAASEVVGDILRKMGFNLDYVSSDWASVVQRRASQQPPDKGGWNVFAVSADGDFFTDPTVHPAIRANGREAWIGWPTSVKLEELYAAWFEAPDQANRKRIAEQMQLQTLQDVPYVILGQVFLPTVVRKDIQGVLPGFPKFWSVRKAAG